jgi:soluble lytic murein transglycosylase-like protein
MTSFLIAVTLCSQAMTWNVARPYDTAFRTCLEVAQGAYLEGIPADLAVALSFTESRFNPEARSSRGARGPLQILPKFHCPDGRLQGCDLVAAGLSALKRYRKRYKRWRDVLCHWNSGNRCYRRSKLFARIVLRRRRALTRALGD